MTTKVKTARYTHTPLNEDVEAFAGYYTPEKKSVWNFKAGKSCMLSGTLLLSVPADQDIHVHQPTTGTRPCLDISLIGSSKRT
jgi:hypothetical protein